MSRGLGYALTIIAMVGYGVALWAQPLAWGDLGILGSVLYAVDLIVSTIAAVIGGQALLRRDFYVEGE